MLTTTLFIALGILMLYQAFLVIAPISPTLRRTLEVSFERRPRTRAVLVPVPVSTLPRSTYVTSRRYDHQTLGM
jgi:hypothetical protein